MLERGWLSSNNILLLGPQSCTLVDSGYVTHAQQTMALVDSVLHGRKLDRLINTHLHSDHCGGNAALQGHHPGLETWIPPGLATDVQVWNDAGLSYLSTGQQCPRFQFSRTLEPGSSMRIGERSWQVHAAPGHDPEAVLLFEPHDGILISADALWNNGFGVVFPEIDGIDGFDAVQETLDLIERLRPQIVIPGHGPVFNDVKGALARARRRLATFKADPARHSHYAAKALLKFKLLEVQSIALDALQAWMQATPVMTQLHARQPQHLSYPEWTTGLLEDLVKSGAARLEDRVAHNS